MKLKTTDFCTVGNVCRHLIFIAVILAATTVVDAADWNTYRGNSARSGSADESINSELHLQWTYIPLHKPVPAWPVPAEEMPRNHSDNAYHACISGGRVYFGSSVTNELVCLDMASGKQLWSFYAQGPIRYAPSIDEGNVYFGSDDGYVYCLDAENGKQIWTYRAGVSGEKVIGNGRLISLWPVRTSVLVDRGEVYFAAGVFPYEGLYICALDAATGKVIWKNDTIGERGHELDFGGISPAGYLLASESLLYVPSGRSLPVAFDRKTGKEKFVALPVGKQGGTWALLDGGTLVAGIDNSGTPRKVTFDANTGKFRGDAFGWFPGIDMAVTQERAYVLTQQGVNSIDRSRYSESQSKAGALSATQKKLKEELKGLVKEIEKANQQEKQTLQQKIDKINNEIAQLESRKDSLKESSDEWFFGKAGLRSLILAGDVVVAGGNNEVVAVRSNDGGQLWNHSIEGAAAGLAVSDGRLLVSSDSGSIYCFGKTAPPKAGITRQAISEAPYPNDQKSALYQKAAKEIVSVLPVKKGYCLVLDCQAGRLAYELAKRTDMQIIGLEKDADKLTAARKKLASAGLLGKRISVESWDIDDLPHYFANLIVSDAMLTEGKTSAGSDQIDRVLRPYGGVAMLGKRDADNEVVWKKTVKGDLPGAGQWTHQYANPQNTASSGDELVSGKLGIQWFGEPGPDGMVERHAKAASPLAMDGRLFVQGEEMIFACDAFNGTLLWKREIPGAFRIRADVDSSNIALGAKGLYVAAYDKCYVLDPATGRDLRILDMPSADTGARRWGYVALVGNTLYGSAGEAMKQEYAEEYKTNYPEGDEEVRWAHQRRGNKWRAVTDLPRWENYIPGKGAKTDRTMTSDLFFALNAETGEVLWQYDGKEMANIAMTVADGSVFLTDATVNQQQRQAAFAERKKLIADGRYEVAAKFKVEDEDRDVRKVVCLDAVTGKERWSGPVDLTGCCGDTLASAASKGVLLLFGSVGSHDMWRYQQGQIEYRRVVAIDAKDGKALWSKPLNYMTRPLIVDDTVIIEPRACDLFTGALKTRLHPVTGQETAWEFLRPGHTCSISAASANSLFYRSSSTAMYNLEEDRGVTVFGGYRPGCWLTVIPASGLVLSAEASSGCTCSYPIRCSFALIRKPNREKPYSVFIASGSNKPVKHLAINLGAPADMKDDNGTVWFGYPGPKNDGSDGKIHFPNYGVKFDFNEEILPGMGYYFSDYRGRSVDGTDKPWLFASGCLGLRKLTVPLIDPAEQPARYTVRLGFMPLKDDSENGRTFDIKLQGKPAEEGFKVAGGMTIKEFKNIAVSSDLKIELEASGGGQTKEQAPLLNFLEIIREDAADNSIALGHGLR